MAKIPSFIQAPFIFIGVLFLALLTTGLHAQDAGANALEWFKTRQKESGEEAAEKEFVEDVFAELNGWIDQADASEKGESRRWFSEFKASPDIWVKLDGLAKQKLLLPDSTDPQALLRAAVYLHINEPTSKAAALYFDKVAAIPNLAGKHQRVLMEYYMAKKFGEALRLLPEMKNEIVLPLAPEVARILLLQPSSPTVLPFVKQALEAIADPDVSKKSVPLTLILPRCFALLAKNQTVAEAREKAKLAGECLKLMEEHNVVGDTVFTILILNPTLVSPEQKDSFAWKCLQSEGQLRGPDQPELSSLISNRIPNGLILPEIPEFYLLKRARVKQEVPDFWRRIEKLPGFEKGGLKHGELTHLGQLYAANSEEFSGLIRKYWDSHLKVAANGGELPSAARTLALLCEAAVPQRRFAEVWKLFWDNKTERFTRKDVSGFDVLIAAGWRILELQTVTEGYEAARKSLRLFTDNCLGPANSLSLKDEVALEKLAQSYDSYMAFWRASGEMPERMLPFFDLCEQGVLTRAFPKSISVHIPTNGISLPPVAFGDWSVIRPLLSQSRMFGDVNDFSLHSIGYYQSESIYFKVVEWAQRNPEFAKTIMASPDAKFGEKLFVSLVNPAGGMSVADVINPVRANIGHWEMYQIKCLASMLVALMDRSPELAKSAEALNWLLPWAKMEQAAQLRTLMQVSSESEWKGFIALQKNSMTSSLSLLSGLDPDRFWKILDILKQWGGGNEPLYSEYTLSYQLRQIWSILKMTQGKGQVTPDFLRTRESRIRCWQLLNTVRASELIVSPSDGNFFSLYWAAARSQSEAEFSVDWNALLDEMGEALSLDSALLFLEELMTFELEVSNKFGPNHALSGEKLSILEGATFKNESAKSLVRMLAMGLRLYRAWWEPMARPTTVSGLVNFFDSPRTNGEGKEMSLTLNDDDEKLMSLVSLIPADPPMARLNALRALSKVAGPNFSVNLLVESSKAILAMPNEPKTGFVQQDTKFKEARIFAAFLIVASESQRQVLQETMTRWADELYNNPPKQGAYANSQYTDIMLEFLFQLKDIERVKSVLARSIAPASLRTFLQLQTQGELAMAVDYWRKNFVDLHQNPRGIHAPSDSLGVKFRSSVGNGIPAGISSLTEAEKAVFEEDTHYMVQKLPVPNAASSDLEPAFSEVLFSIWWTSLKSLPADWKLVLIERAVLKSRFREFFPQEVVQAFLKEYTLPAPSNTQPTNSMSSYGLVRRTLTGLPRMHEQIEIALARSSAAGGDWDLLLKRAAQSFSAAAAYNQAQIDPILAKGGNAGGGFGRDNPYNPTLNSGNAIMAEFHWFTAVLQTAMQEWPRIQPLQKMTIYEFLWGTVTDPRLLAAFDPYQPLEMNDAFAMSRNRHRPFNNDVGLTTSFQIEDSTRLLFLLLFDHWDGQAGRILKRCLQLPADRLDQIRTAMQGGFWNLAVIRLSGEISKLPNPPKLTELAIPATNLRFSVLGDSPAMEKEFMGYTLRMALREQRERDKKRWGFSTQEYVNFLMQVIPDCRQSPELAMVALWAIEENESKVLQLVKKQLMRIEIKVERPEDFWIRLEMACLIQDHEWAKTLLDSARDLVSRPAPPQPSAIPSSKTPSAGFPPRGFIRSSMGREGGKLTVEALSGSVPTWAKFQGSAQNNFQQIAKELSRLGLIYEADGKKEAASASYILAAKYYWASRRQSALDPMVYLDLTEIDSLASTVESMGLQTPIALPRKRSLHDPALSRMAMVPADFQEPIDLENTQLKWSGAAREAQWIPFPDQNSLRQPAPKLIYHQVVNFDPHATTVIRYIASDIDGEIRLYINGVLMPFLQPSQSGERVGARRAGVQDGWIFVSLPASAFKAGRNDVVWVNQQAPIRAVAGQSKSIFARWFGYKIPPETWIKDLEIIKVSSALPEIIARSLPPILPLK